MRISDWSSDVCSSDLAFRRGDGVEHDDVRFPRHALGDMAKHPGFADAGIATNLYKPVLIQRGIDFGDDVEPRQMHSCESVADIGKRETGHLFQSFTGWPEITIARQAKSALRKLIRQRLTMKRSADLPGDRKSTRLNSSP